MKFLTFVDLLLYIATNIEYIALFSLAVLVIAATIILCLSDWYNHRISEYLVSSNKSVIYITDLTDSVCFVDGTVAKFHKHGFNRFSQRPIYVCDVHDINGIITAFKNAQRDNKNIIIFIDTMSDDEVITQKITKCNVIISE